MQSQSLPKSPPQRAVTIAMVGALHIAAIYALIVSLGIHVPIINPKHDHIDASIFPPKPPPPTPVPTSDIPNRIPGTDVRPPVIDIDNSPPRTGPTITMPPGGQQVAPTQSSLTPPRAIADTHSIPDYPAIAVRLNEFGSVRLALSIDERGFVIDARVVTSSGYDTLDTAAVAWVKARWRYQPALRDGKPISSTTDAVVTFRLINRQG